MAVEGARGTMELASSAIAGTHLDDDPLFAPAILRGHRLIGGDPSPLSLLASWQPGVTRQGGAVRYRWPIDPRFSGALPPRVGGPPSWHPWREREAVAHVEEPALVRPFIDRLITPLVIADSLQLLDDALGQPGESRDLAQRYLDETLPKARRDAAAWVHQAHTWSDTWALWAIARRPAVLTRLQPFAVAIADSYAYTASRDPDSLVRETRYPFHEVPLVSAAGQLAGGLVALGIHPKLVGRLAEWIRGQQHQDGGWGDGDGPSDLPTTLVAAELLASLDPAYDPAATAAWMATRQRPDGWWRACGPESTWLSVEILGWLLAAERPFAERFRWPNLALANRDRRTGLPFYAYYADLHRLFTEIPTLANAQVEVAFVDLAGFGTFNNGFGMAMGDRALRAFAQALARIPGSMAIRDGGDEFIVVAPPTSTGLPERLREFTASWPHEFAETFATAAVVAPRVLTAVTRGSGLVAARDELGIQIARLKERWPTVTHEGVQVDLGRLS